MEEQAREVDSTAEDRPGSTRGSGPSARAKGAAERRSRIVQAALAEFSDKGFAAARMEDVARHAGVAKGTIYLHFADKRALFEGLVREMLGPVLARLVDEAPAPGERVGAFLERTLLPLLLELIGSERGDVIRLLVAEGGRFPDLAAIYHREVIEPGLGALRRVLGRARGAGELRVPAAADVPQLLFAPALVGLVWSRLFEPHEALDVEALLRAQLEAIFLREGEPLRPA